GFEVAPAQGLGGILDGDMVRLDPRDRRTALTAGSGKVLAVQIDACLGLFATESVLHGVLEGASGGLFGSVQKPARTGTHDLAPFPRSQERRVGKDST